VKAGEKVDKHRLTQVGRAMKELGIQMIAAYSPQARGRPERSFGTWQGRLPQDLRLAGITTVEGANGFLRERYIEEFNAKFSAHLGGEHGYDPRTLGRNRVDPLRPSRGGALQQRGRETARCDTPRAPWQRRERRLRLFVLNETKTKAKPKPKAAA
jgi:hypothetical protein